jgi:hypothetical protein
VLGYLGYRETVKILIPARPHITVLFVFLKIDYEPEIY